MANRKSVSVKFLTEQETKFVLAYNGNAVQAATDAGVKKPRVNASKIMKRPRVAKALLLKQEAMLKAAGKETAKRIGLPRGDIIDRLRTIAMTKADCRGGYTSQVQALKLASEIQGFIVQKNLNLTEHFRNRSDKELEHFAIHGYWPELGNAGEPGNLGSEGSGPAVRGPEKIQ